MKTTREEKKAKAIALLQQLQIYKPYIEGFEQKDEVCFYERFGGYWVYQEPEIEQKMKEIEKEYNCVVYAITHEVLEFGDCWSFLLVPDYKEEWDDLVSQASGNTYYAFAYVWNKTVDYNSEFGSIAVKTLGGGLCRVG